MFGITPEHPTYAYGESMTPSLQYGWSPLHCLRSPRYKFVQAPRPELYDLAADPDESHNIVREQQDVARRDGRRAEAGAGRTEPRCARA